MMCREIADVLVTPLLESAPLIRIGENEIGHELVMLGLVHVELTAQQQALVVHADFTDLDRHLLHHGLAGMGRNSSVACVPFFRFGPDEGAT